MISLIRSWKTNKQTKLWLKVLGSQNRKKESKIAVAKTQRKEKAFENRTKEDLRTRVRTSGETNSPPGQPNVHRAGSGEEKRKKKKKYIYIYIYI